MIHDLQEPAHRLEHGVAGFLPADNPRYSFAVLYEGRPGETVSGGRMAAPMVKRFFEGIKEDIKDTIAPPKKALIVVDESEGTVAPEGEAAPAQAAARGAWFALRTGLVRKDASSRIRDLGARLGIAAFDEGDDAAARCLAAGFTDLAGAAGATIPPRLLRPGERAGFFLRLPSGMVKSTVVWVEHDPRLPEAAVVRHVDATDSARAWGEAPLTGPGAAPRQHHVFFRRGLILRLAVEQPADAPVFRLVVTVNPADATPPPGGAPAPAVTPAPVRP